MFGISKVFIFTPVGNGSHHSEIFSQAHFPAQELLSSGSILAQPSPYKNHPTCPTFVVLSPAKNKQLYQRSPAAVASVPSMSPLVSVTGSLSHSSVTGSVSQSSSSHVPASAAPPHSGVQLLQHSQSLPSGGVSKNALDHSNTTTTTEAQVPSHSNSIRDTGNKPGYDTIPKDPSSALIEQHNVRVVPAVLSFGSLSSFGLSTSSASQQSIPQSVVQANTSTSIMPSQPSVTGTPSLFKPSDTYNSPSIGPLSSTISWLHPNKPLSTDAINCNTPQWSSSRPVQQDLKVKSYNTTHCMYNCISTCCN